LNLAFVHRTKTPVLATLLTALTATVLGSMVPSAAAASSIDTTADVNIRVAPNLSGAVITKIPNGTTPSIRCASSGQAIYDNAVWFYVDLHDNVRGFFSAYYSTADFRTWDDLRNRYGVVRCDRAATTVGGSMYYQPRYDAADPIAPYAAYTATKDWWSREGSDCSTQYSDYWPASFDGRKITRASAWSLGRLGITYLLKQNPTRSSQLDTIILFDPGSLGDYESYCDLKYPQDELMATWLSGSSSRRLIVLAGKVTRDVDHPDAQGRHHQGIQRHLFPAIRNAGRASQVLVCNYDSVGHPDLLRTFSSLVASGSATSCPTSGSIRPNAAWHP
jgi:hypothetical protein